MRPFAENAERRAAGMVLRRRTQAEQRTLRLLRSEAENGAAPDLASHHFANLRALAVRNGLVIQPLGARFAHRDELAILAWLAQAQRVASYRLAFHRDPKLALTVVYCAGMLDALGIRLPAAVMGHAPTQHGADEGP